ncbi:DUF5908 family protein [Marinobacterium sp. YM272]|uniref:DUF5908 family protein n=1 Tax=Marinobacterium sp. YM272 TaxID=3421654 RepID=UPI003D7FEFDF
MPIVIHELVVTAEVEQRISTESNRESGERQSIDREELIRECTEQVLKQLQRQKER